MQRTRPQPLSIRRLGRTKRWSAARWTTSHRCFGKWDYQNGVDFDRRIPWERSTTAQNSTRPISPTDTAQRKPEARPMRIECIAFTASGVRLAQRLAEFFRDGGDICTVSAPEKYAKNGVAALGSLADWTARSFGQADALIFVSACGIAVRSVAPHLRSKFTDPAVVAVDDLRTVCHTACIRACGGSQCARPADRRCNWSTGGCHYGNRWERCICGGYMGGGSGIPGRASQCGKSRFPPRCSMGNRWGSIVTFQWRGRFQKESFLRRKVKSESAYPLRMKRRFRRPVGFFQGF